ncbi:MAG: efflux RND transporter permease subunit, partial [Chrysiogenetes bacterium]|nr:efflux RND transporter permease subunit [Chrysiogenetes bacterium]
MIEKLICGSARNPFVVLLLVAALSGWGYWAARNTTLDAIPDLSDVQVIVFTEWPGRSPDLVEDQITYPLVTTLLAAPKVQFVRGQTMFGLSFVNVIFDDGTDIYWARSRVMEYLNTAAQNLPSGVTPTLGPDATGVGWVFEYALVDRTGQHDLQELRSIQDWNLRYALQAVKGVAEVASVGGFVKQYQIHIDPNRLLAYNLPLKKVIDAVRDSNNDVGGRVLEVAGTEHMIRGRGYIKSVADLETIPVAATSEGTPVLVRDIGEVHLGPDMRRGAIDLDGEGEAVGGIVIMRYGENALETIDRVKARIEQLKDGLPDGVELVVTYDRSDLIKKSIRTLTHTLIEEMIVVSLVIFLFLFHVRSALVPIITLPLAVLLAFIPMYYQGLTANIMSLGGIAVAIGAMVDASIIIIENIHRKLEEWERNGRAEPRLDVMIRAMQEVGPSIFFSLLVITVSFLPIFVLQGQEGRLFRPIGFTKTYSMGFAAFLAVTLTPVLAVLFIRGRIRPENESRLNRWLVAAYEPVVRFVVRRRYIVLASAVAVMLSTVPVFLHLGSEFMPPLNEGSILYMPTAVPGMSLDTAVDTMQRMNRVLKDIPEVDHVFGKAGRSRTATDPAPLSMIETVITLRPQSQWRKGLSWDDLVAEMDRKLRVPGMPNIFWMPIQTRTEMLATGIRSALGIKVLGPDLKRIEELAIEIEKVVSEIPGTRSAFAERVTGGNFIDFEIRREAAARYGLTVGDVERVIETGIGGMNISSTVEGRERYPINVRYSRDYRSDLDALGRVLVHTPTGAQVPLAQLADIRTTTGPPGIRDENGQLVGYVFVDVDHSRAIGDYVEQAKRVVAEKIDQPAGYHLAWGGQYRYLERAKERLKVVVPVTLFLVFLLLYLNTRSLTETFIVVLAVPFSLVGAVWLLWLLDYNMSVAVWVGIIALAGLDAETGVVMLL